MLSKPARKTKKKIIEQIKKCKYDVQLWHYLMNLAEMLKESEKETREEEGNKK